MSFPSSTNPSETPRYRKPRVDIYTVMLIVSLVAVLLGILCLYLENKAYNWEFKGGPTVSAQWRQPALVAWNDGALANSLG